jgi:PEP-CTERM motif
MGGHSYDLTGPEFNGGQFTQSMLYGFYNMQQAFLEGAGTQTFLKGLSSQQQYVLRQPSQYALPSLPALVPHSYQFSYDPVNDQYFMSIGQFASTAVPEPGSLSLLGLSGIALAAWRRRVSVQKRRRG